MVGNCSSYERKKKEREREREREREIEIATWKTFWRARTWY